MRRHNTNRIQPRKSFIKAAFGIAMASLPGQVPAQYGFGGADNRDRNAAAYQSTPASSFGWNYGNTNQPILNNTPSLVPTNPAAQTYTLGVVVDNTDHGCVVSRVQPGSPATRAGIEPGDVIVTVGGFQVGYVDSRLYDVGDEISRRANAQGRVSLVAQDRRTGQLELVNVDLQAAVFAIQGDAIYRDRQQLPNNAYLQVRVENVSRPYAAVNGGTQTFGFAGSSTPFQLNLDPQYLYPNDRFQVTAQVIAGSQTLLVSRQPIPIDINGTQSPVRLELVSLNNTTNANSGAYSAAYGIGTQSIIDYYNKFLRRQPSQGELIAWEDHINRGRSINDLPTLLISSPEFYENSGGTNIRFLEQMFRTAAGRSPNQAELSQWANEFQNLRNDRVALVRRFYGAMGIR